MRASRWFSALCIMYGALLFATATALWPTRAYADVIDVDLTWDALRLYVEPTMQPTDMQQSDMRALSTFTGFVPEIDVGSVSHKDEYRFVTYPAFTGFGSVMANCTMALYIPLGSSVIPKDYSFRVVIPTTSWSIKPNNTSSNWTNFSASIRSVWVGTSIGGLEQCQFSSGAYKAPKAASVVVVLFNTNGRTTNLLSSDHFIRLLGTPKLYIELPDMTAQEINAQSVQNTEDIVTSQEQQTDALKDTTGSQSIVGPATTQGQNVFENLSLVTTMEGAFDNINQAISTQDSDTGIPFPGMSMAGFVIPAYNVDPTQMMPEIMPYVKGMLTFVFCCAFLSHIVHLIQAIFGIYDYGEMVLDDHVPDVGYTVSKKFKPDYDIDEDLGF